MTVARILLLGHFLNLTPGDQISQADIAEKRVDLITQITPQMMGQAGIATLAVTLPLAAGGIHRVIHGINHLGHMNTVQLARQLVATARPTHTGNQIATTQLGKQLLEIRQGNTLALGDVGQGNRPLLAVQRQMIRRTIREHLEKEKFLRPKGIKVLSLFFIDSVERYRQYDEGGQPVKGDYARIFEEEYRRAAKLPAFQSLFAEIDLESGQVHIQESRDGRT